MAAKMAALFPEQHILLSVVHFFCMALKVSYLSQLELFMKILNLAHLHIQYGDQIA